MKEKDEKIVKGYEFVPEYNRWITMKKQREIVNKLENITEKEQNNQK